jgi:hypothetical protein
MEVDGVGPCVDVIFIMITWQPSIRPFAYNLQQSKDPSGAKTSRGLAGGASSNAQVSKESEYE